MKTKTNLSHIMRKTDFCLCENKGADQLCSNCEADQRLCFCYSDSTIPLLDKSEFSSFYTVSVTVQLGLCRKPRRPGFLRHGSFVMQLLCLVAYAVHVRQAKFCLQGCPMGCGIMHLFLPHLLIDTFHIYKVKQT